MASLAKHEILLVDDDDAVRDSLGMILSDAGYVVGLAANGFEGLMHLRTAFPTVIISDLNMPQMSGVEFLSVVRRRFPHISVIAMSGEYDHEGVVPEGVIADAFFPKGRGAMDELLKTVATLIHNSAARALEQTDSSAAWIPRNGNDSGGVPYVVLTCTECLRSFPQSLGAEDLQEIQQTSCLFCPNTVRYIIESAPAMAVARSEAEPVTMMRRRLKTATRA